MLFFLPFSPHPIKRDATVSKNSEEVVFIFVELEDSGICFILRER